MYHADGNKEKVIYGGRDAIDKFYKICSMEKSVQSCHRRLVFFRKLDKAISRIDASNPYHTFHRRYGQLIAAKTRSALASQKGMPMVR
jgi:hypothetical protein